MPAAPLSGRDGHGAIPTWPDILPVKGHPGVWYCSRRDVAGGRMHGEFAAKGTPTSCPRDEATAPQDGDTK